VYYPTGQSFQVTLRAVRPYLQGVNSTPPDDVVIPVPSAITTDTARVYSVTANLLPDCLDITCFEALKAALSILMPGHWSDALLLHYTSLVADHPAWLCLDGSLYTSGSEVCPLLKALDLGGVCSVMDLQHTPDQQCSPLSTAINVRVLDVVSAQLAYNLPCIDPLQPLFWRSIMRAGRCPDVVVCAPHHAIVDVALPLFIEFVSCVCCLLPVSYLVEAPEPRVQWLRRMQSTGRIQVVYCHSLSQVYLWVCVFSSPSVKHLLLRDVYKSQSHVCHVLHD
jgi:hypothetical protein